MDKRLRIEVAYATREEQAVREVELAVGACVADALAAVAHEPPFSDLDLKQHAVGVFGRVCDESLALNDGDRVEIYRELLVDAKAARQQRAARQAAKRRGAS